MEVTKKVPSLRFSGFEGDWEEKKLGEVLKIKHGKDQKNVECVDGSYPILGTGGILGYTHSFLYDKESVLIGRKGTIDKPMFMKSPFWTVDTLFYSEIFDQYKPKCLYYLFQTITWKKYSESTGVPSLSASTIMSIKKYLPSLPEQQKIADCLTAMDETIDTQQQKVEQLQSYKKGLLQQLFSQTLRFPGFEGAWEEKKLGEVCKITTGKLDANAMVEGGAYHFFTCAKECFKIDKYAFDAEALLISGNGANVGYIHYFNGKFNAYQRTYVLDSFQENIFYVKFFLEKYLPYRISREKNDGATPYIVLNTLYGMNIKYPNSFEQQKIADCLSTLDEVIELEQQKLEKLQVYKKGLLQQLFV